MTHSSHTAAAIAAAFLGVWLVIPSLAAVPDSVNYQGYLTDVSTGAPLDTAIPIAFRLYTVATGGTAIWSETHAVGVARGLFDVALGADPANRFPPGAFDTPLWLGMTVGADAEMVPRRPLSSVGYAFSAGNADALQGRSAAELDQSVQVSDNAADLAQEIADRIADVNAEEAARLAAGYLTAEIDPHAVLADGTRAMTDNLDMGGNSITNLADASLAFADGTQISSADVGQWNAAYL